MTMQEFVKTYGHLSSGEAYRLGKEAEARGDDRIAARFLTLYVSPENLTGLDQEEMADEVAARIGRESMAAIELRNRRRAGGETLEFFRDSDGSAQYQFRAATNAERREHWSGVAEDCS